MESMQAGISECGAGGGISGTYATKSEVKPVGGAEWRRTGVFAATQIGHCGSGRSRWSGSSRKTESWIPMKPTIMKSTTMRAVAFMRKATCGYPVDD
jgi:hypothetical protein